MIIKLANGKYRLVSEHINRKTGKRRNLGTYKTRKAAQQREKQIRRIIHMKAYYGE